MIDIGIDWNAMYGAGWIRRSSAAPAFSAAGSLLHSAARLWQGRYGAGRIVGKHALELAAVLKDLSQHWVESGANWTANIVPNGAFGESGGYLLGKFRDRRRFLTDEAQALKHPNAARRLTTAALELASSRLEAIRDSGRSVGDYGKDVALWEDRFEALGETPLGTPPDPPLSQEGLTAIERFAAYRACESYACAAGNVYAFAGHWRDTDRKRPPEVDAWKVEEMRFREAARAAYETFAAGPGLPADETVALLSVRDDAVPYMEFAEFHHYGPADRHGAALLATLYISFLLASIDAEEALRWDASTLGLALARAGIKKLPPPSKALQAPT